MKTPRDFDRLSEMVFGRTRERVSTSTLKRLWGYVDNGVRPRAFTLDVLARFAGYESYDAFVKRNGKPESNIVLERRLAVDGLTVGARLKFTWLPDRMCVVEHRGGGRFVVLSVENAKLSVGDTFTCHLMIEHEPLFIDNLVHSGGEPTAYVAGREHGVSFELITDEVD